MRRPSSVSAKGTLRKSAVLTVKQLSSQIGENMGVKRNCFLKKLRIVCRFLRISFFCACPGISPQRRSARSHRGGRGRIISHSDGHSIVRSTHCPPTNQLENYFRFERRFFVNFLLMNMERQKEPVHSTSNQREKISRYIFDETMYRL